MRCVGYVKRVYKILKMSQKDLALYSITLVTTSLHSIP